ncbi:hypothetical protein I4U23_030231 [Adineta vaga]|nr:hypothetical protein I4U23_030231 [Adineta vaga]
MTEHNTLLNQIWANVSDTMDRMFELQPITTARIMQLYNEINNYYISSERDNAILQGAREKTEAEKNASIKDKKDNENVESEKKLPGGELYYYLKDYCRQRLEKIAENGDNLRNEEFLRFYAKTWKTYQFLSQVINSLFTPMNNNWISRQHKSDITGIHDVYTTAMYIWRDVFFKEKNQSLAQTCLKLIRDEREGKYVDPLLIRQVIQSYVSAGYTEQERKNSNNRTTVTPSLETYTNYFEKQFLQETEEFYTIKSNEYLKDNSVLDYLKKITQHLAQEEHRTRECLHPTTLSKIKPLLETILIENKLQLIYPDAIQLLRMEKTDDLRIIFDLINRIEGANAPIQKEIESLIYQNGIAAIEGIKATADKEPGSYVEAIIGVYTRFTNLIDNAFCNERGYLTALNKACSKFINDNAVTQEAKRSTKSSELLSRYCDILLRKGNKLEANEVETKIKQIIDVFNYIEDKDVFQKFYRKFLAKRLTNQLSASDDFEELMITKLREKCGFEYASKLQRMFQDIGLSNTLIVSFSVMVLTSNAWPFSIPRAFNLPIKVSVYQMAILLLFNSKESMTVEAMLDAIQIDSILLVQVLLTILKSKLLTCSGIDSDQIDDDFEESNIKTDSVIHINSKFTSKRIRFSLNQPIKAVEQKDTDATNQTIEEDRKFLIQAAIVRTMKARQELSHALLTQEVIEQLNSRFIPQISLIKKCIDLLLEKEYLERSTENRNLYRYLA